jgi:hypothetical protein
MKPSWDKLMKEWEDSKVGLVGDVDCTAAGESLCQRIGVEGYPTIKWGDPAALEDYDGGRDLKDLQKFAKESLKPICSINNLDLCDADQKAEFAKFQAMSTADLDKAITESEGALKAAEGEFEAEVKKLQEKYESLEKAKTDKIAALKKGGLGLMKAVKAAKEKKEEL